MKRKPVPTPETIVPKEILERARLATKTDRLEHPVKCVVCGSQTAPNCDENLCWVCRRLKISAWRDSDQQISVQE
jgi:hypothetical protein